MASPVADGESSPAPTGNEGETPAEAVVTGVGVAVREGVMEVGGVAAVGEPDEVEPEEDEEAVEPEKARATGEEPDEEAKEDPDEDPDEENVREEADDASDEEAVMEPLAVLNPGEVQEEENESEETEEEEEDKEPSGVDEESEEVDVEEPEDTKKGVEAGVIAEDGAKGLVHEAAADGVNDKIEGEHVKCGDKNKDEVADMLSNGDDAGGSRNGDMQNSELAGGFELLVHEWPMNCVEEDIAVLFSGCGEIKSVRIH